MAAPRIPFGETHHGDDSHPGKVLRLPPESVGLHRPATGDRTMRAVFEKKYATEDMLVQGETPMPFRPARRPVPEYFTNLSDPMNPKGRQGARAGGMTATNIASDPTYAGKRNAKNGAAPMPPGQARVQRDRDFAGTAVAYETGYAPEGLWNPVQGKYQAHAKEGARRNPITWDGVPEEKHSVRATPKPSEALQLQNDRRSGIMHEDFVSAPPPSPPKRTPYQGFHTSNPQLLAWDKGDAPPSYPRGGSKAREVNLMLSSPELLDSITWPQQRGEQPPPLRTGPAHQHRMTDMSGSAAKQLMSFGGEDAAYSDKVKRPVIRTREEANQRKFDQVVTAMSVNKTVSDTYGELFKARDRNSQNQLS